MCSVWFYSGSLSHTDIHRMYVRMYVHTLVCVCTVYVFPSADSPWLRTNAVCMILYSHTLAGQLGHFVSYWFVHSISAYVHICILATFNYPLN